MELQITGYNNFFKMKGILSKPNLSVFKNEFNNIFEKVNKITISIENIEWMDKYGVQALANLHTESIIKNKELSIIGLGCKELYEHFTTEMRSNLEAETAA
jgi:hypothetical protein